MFCFFAPERLHPVLVRSGSTMEHVEAMHVPVVEAEDGGGRALELGFGGLVAELVGELPSEAQRAWEEEVVRECEHHRRDGRGLLGGVTWLAVARRTGAVSR